MSKLVIVESPAKAKTIEKYLGSGYKVVASMGHIRDLPKSLLGVDIENKFKPRYMDIPGKTALIRQLKTAAASSDGVILATDPDREGEAISWHLAQILKMDINENNRVTFNEITKNGVSQGMDNPRSLDMNLVNAQQARRILDRIVGYKISPFLWKKIRKGLSAGRVQSVAVRIIVDREEEIRAFVSEEYWTIDARLSKGEKGQAFSSRLYGTHSDGKIKIQDKQTADKILNELDSSEFKIDTVKRGKRQLSPAPPFITSTLQQEASRKLGFVSRRTMKAAQELYEGVEVEGYGAVGLITYMRTDSLRISDDARRDGYDYIKERWGEKYIPPKPRIFKSRSSAQDAHEAIRPTMPALPPERVRDSLSPDQFKLYKLIWERFIASLMANCIHDTVKMDISAGDYIFRASGYTVRFDGHTVIYVEGKDEEGETDGPLPALEEGTVLFKRELKGNQHFTQPPPRFTEATLIKALEENGIGRPSTYSPTITTILSREYIEREGKALKPTVLGEITTGVMKEQFSEIVDVDFTANMEKQLDAVDSGKTDWVKALEDFYGNFSKTLGLAEKSATGERIVIPDEVSDVVCEQCGKNMIIKSGRYGKFLACPGYPECKNTKKIIKKTGGICPKCGGTIVAQKTKRNRIFYGCSNYPDCDFMTWNEPSDKVCPKCGKTLYRKKGKAGGLFCATEGCEYTALSQ
ncbi:MAG: type I DNA topoisomerase [Oscillospiraceae bacterium]|nr:type I DNA topoisomerase [Oscillospiraceae bacterium]MDD3833209.1 type I DNA topoisomerase [Oscillospiraceae bacterium]MDD4546009.1 type I DNA topoisomerase [Oscillospiraceae bacterium]